jgi:hypothetical protein
MARFTGKNILIWGLVTPVFYVAQKAVLLELGYQAALSSTSCALLIAIAILAKP